MPPYQVLPTSSVQIGKRKAIGRTDITVVRRGEANTEGYSFHTFLSLVRLSLSIDEIDPLREQPDSALDLYRQCLIFIGRTPLSNESLRGPFSSQGMVFVSR